MANQPTSMERIEARIDGDVSGQIAVGTHILQIGSVHGGVVNVAVPGEQLRPKARSVPIQLRPRPFPGMLDRTEESAAAMRALDTGQSVEVFGQTGIGKTVLLRHVAHTIDSTHFRDGIIYREIHDEPPGDALQVLWGDFFECDVSFKPTDSQLRSDLQTKQALIILDAVELSRVEIEQVMNVAAGSTFLLGSPERHLWGDDTHATHLSGLPTKDAKTLIEREIGRPLTEDEVLAVETLAIALRGNPLRILQEVAMARLNDRSLTGVAQDLQSDPSPEGLTASIITPLSEVQKRMLSALAMFSGASVQPGTLGELLQVDDAETVLEELEKRHLVRATKGGYKLIGEVTPKGTDTIEERKRAVAYFANWIGQHQRDVKTILAALPVLMCCLRWAVKFGLAAEVMRIIKSLEFTLVLNGRWESWANALHLAGQSAIAAKDKAALGWVCHQLGTRALCDGNLPEARESFKQALHIREALRDKAGAAVTRHNLNLFAPLTVPPWKIWTVPAGIAAVVCTFIAAMVFGSKIPNLWHPSRTSALKATTTSAPVRPSTATMALTSSGPSAQTRSGPTGHSKMPVSSSHPPVIPLPAGPAPPEPPQAGIPPYFRPPIILGAPLRFRSPIDRTPMPTPVGDGDGSPTPVGHGVGTPKPTPVGHGDGTPKPTPVGHPDGTPKPTPVGHVDETPKPTPGSHVGKTPKPTPGGHVGKTPKPTPGGHVGKTPRPTPVGHVGKMPKPAPVGHVGVSPTRMRSFPSAPRDRRRTLIH